MEYWLIAETLKKKNVKAVKKDGIILVIMD